MEEQKIRVIDSIRTKVVIAMFGMALAAAVLLTVLITPEFTNTVDSNIQSYMKDMAKAYGTMFHEETLLVGSETALSADNIKEAVGGVTINNLKSSYIYVVSGDGTMLYHPTAEKIGKPVENTAVTATVGKIANGERPDNEIIEYDFKGVKKYAGIYVNENLDFIVVVTVDKSEVMAPINRTLKKSVINVIVILIVIIIVGMVLSYKLIAPINQISDITVELADMNFAEYPKLNLLSTKKDEVGRMSRSLDYLRKELVNAFEDIKTKSDNVMSASNALSTDADETTTTMEQVENAVNDIAQGATSQAEETQKATENVLVMGNMIEETNNEVNGLLEFANDIHLSANHAKQTLKELEQVNKQAEQYIDIIAGQTNTTNASALQISEATKLITSIAEETNLLSLNASIEAARAGEQGRGFAVVAAEIQKLAEQSNESAQQIEVIIQQLLYDSEKAVSTMSEVKDIMQLQSEHVEQTDKAFHKITEGIEESIKGINRIHDKTSNLDDARVNVVDIVQNLTAIAEQNAASTEETSASTTEVTAIIEDISDKSEALREVAEALDKNIEIFRF